MVSSTICLAALLQNIVGTIILSCVRNTEIPTCYTPGAPAPCCPSPYLATGAVGLWSQNTQGA